jgi:hypothetical protein
MLRLPLLSSLQKGLADLLLLPMPPEAVDLLALFLAVCKWSRMSRRQLVGSMATRRHLNAITPSRIELFQDPTVFPMFMDNLLSLKLHNLLFIMVPHLVPHTPELVRINQLLMGPLNHNHTHPPHSLLLVLFLVNPSLNKYISLMTWLALSLVRVAQRLTRLDT